MHDVCCPLLSPSFFTKYDLCPVGNLYPKENSFMSLNNNCVDAGVRTVNDNSSLTSYRKLVMMAGTASVITGASFVLLKLIVWFMSSSSSMFASFIDSLFDSLASVLNLFVLRYSMKAPDVDHRFGHYKAQSLASLAQSAFMGGSAVLLVIHGIDRFRHPQAIENAPLALAVAFGTIVAALLLVAFQTYVCRRTSNELIKADRFHYISDMGLNFGVIGALLLSYFGYLWADGFFAIIIGLLILRGAYVIGVEAAGTLVDKSLNVRENQAIMMAVLKTNGVKSLHDLKTRRAGPEYYIQCHIVLNPSQTLADAHNVADSVENAIRAIFPEADISLHMEPDTPEIQQDAMIFVEDLKEGLAS